MDGQIGREIEDLNWNIRNSEDEIEIDNLRYKIKKNQKQIVELLDYAIVSS